MASSSKLPKGWTYSALLPAPRTPASHPYFAYGSNVDRQQLTTRVPGATLIGRGWAIGWRLEFVGGFNEAVATIVPASKFDAVPGLIWSLPSYVELDRYESVGSRYERDKIEVVDDRRRPVGCETYFAKMRTMNWPRDGYSEIIERGLQAAGLSMKHVRRARERAYMAATTRFPGIDGPRAAQLKPLLYFAYGSNLDFELMRLRSAGSEPLAVCWAQDHQLEYAGPPMAFATIVPKPGSMTPGVLWLVRDWRSLDMSEGVPNLYTRGWIDVVTSAGLRVPCQAYLHTSGERGLPGGSYHDLLLRACSELGFNSDHIERALKRAEEDVYDARQTAGRGGWSDAGLFEDAWEAEAAGNRQPRDGKPLLYVDIDLGQRLDRADEETAGDIVEAVIDLITEEYGAYDVQISRSAGVGRGRGDCPPRHRLPRACGRPRDTRPLAEDRPAHADRRAAREPDLQDARRGAQPRPHVQTPEPLHPQEDALGL